MHIPYMKIVIFTLTILTYANIGHGANIMEILRDAIGTAESVFGDVFKNVIGIAGKFKNVHEIWDAAVEENCIYKCPGDKKPVTNKFHKPSADGCGSLGLKINTDYLPAIEMKNCCDEHDICYDTCNKDKELCDIDFKRCLYNYCDSYQRITAMAGTDIIMKGCKAAAKMLSTGTTTLGCKPYLNAQKKACYCPGEGGGGGTTHQNNQQQYHDTTNTKKNNYNNRNNDKYENDKKQKDQPPPNYGWKDPNEI